MHRYLIEQNPDVELNWAGWVSTPRRLVAAGWDVSVDQRPRVDRFGDTLTFAIRHRQAPGISGLTDPLDWHMLEEIQRQMQQAQAMRMPPLQMRMNIGAPLRIQFMGEPFSFAEGFEPHDPTPRLVDVQERDLHELEIFSTIPRSTEQILIDDVSLDQVLDIALKKQEGIQDRYRQFKYEQELLSPPEPLSTPARILRLVS